MLEDRPSSARSRLTLAAKWAAALGAVGAALLGLAWRGLLPGGHRLRQWVNEERHAQRIEGFAREAGSAPAGAVVFLGSSTIELFPLDKSYPGVACLNRGVGGDTTPGLLRRLDASLPVARPAGIVIYSGANDLRVYHDAPGDIVATTGRLLDALDARFPGVPVALVETLPLSDPPPGDPGRLSALNKGLSALAAARGASLVEVNRPPLADAEGRLVREMSVDGEHLNEAGYAVLSRWVAEGGGAATASLRGR